MLARRLWLAAIAVLLAALLISPRIIADEPPSSDEQFRRTVLPILESRCFSCHSHAAEISGGLALDYASGWRKGGDRGPAIVPSDPEKSLLIQAIERRTNELAMPPDDPLPQAEIEILRRWIAEGAHDPRTLPPTNELDTSWWSLQPLSSPPVPIIDANEVPGNPIDAFLGSQHSSRNITPSTFATRRNLLRRLSVDLLGVMPTLEEYQAFEQDDAPEWYEHAVDRMLASPQYGERWARHWLDWIHFADSHGFEHDVMRPHAWRYRDFVIQSLNADIPYPEWIRQQIAADVLYPDRSELTPALGFLAAGPWDQSTAATAQQTFDYIDRDNMLTLVMSVLTSSTVHCARCHNHKFDPIPQADYYALQAVFAGIGRGNVPFDSDPEIHRVRTQANAWLTAAGDRDRRVLLSTEISSLVSRWEWAQQSNPVAWSPLPIDMMISTSGADLVGDGDSIAARGARPEQDTYVITSHPPSTRVTGVKLEVLSDESLPMKGPGRNDNGNFHLSEFVLEHFPSGSKEPVRVRLSNSRADFDQEGWTIAHAIDGNPITAWGIHPKVGQDHTAVFILESPLSLAAGDRLAIQMRQLHGGFHTIGRFRLSMTDAADSMASLLPPAVVEALAVAKPDRSEAQSLEIAAYVVTNEAKQRLSSLPEASLVYAAGPKFHPLPQSEFYKSWSAPKSVFVLKRGNIATPGDSASPGALQCLDHEAPRFTISESASEGERRAALAMWVTHPENPLFWRSIVNRLWLHHFGAGIVDTPNDFGRMGSLPSHPELLDMLADSFRQKGGSLKQLHRMMVTSAAYRRTSEMSDEQADQDPDNRLLTHWKRRRIDAETFRDSLLQVGGTVDGTMGGPAVHWFRLGPAIQVTNSVDYSGFDWTLRVGNRRSIYRFVYRGQQDPFMEALDFPDAAQLTPQRSPSASPLQALALWNHDFVLYACQRIADRVVRESPSKPVQTIFRLLLLREPSDGELKKGTEHVEKHSLASLVRVLINTNEFLFLD
ncbi:MAG: DUF1553 domain-containing protein [Planctomycetes bacterium]|nr:DUF1553 domain-containing protein [Planctomycetota bacterium]